MTLTDLRVYKGYIIGLKSYKIDGYVYGIINLANYPRQKLNGDENAIYPNLWDMMKGILRASSYHEVPTFKSWHISYWQLKGTVEGSRRKRRNNIDME